MPGKCDCGYVIPPDEEYYTTGYPVRTLCWRCAGKEAPNARTEKPIISVNTTGEIAVPTYSHEARAGEDGTPALITRPQGISKPLALKSATSCQDIRLLQAQIIHRIEQKIIPLLGEDFENTEYAPWERNQLMTEALVRTAKTSFVYTCVLLAENARQAFYSLTGHETFDNYLDHLELDRSQKSRYLCIGNAVLNGVLKLDDALDIPKSNLNLITPLLRQQQISSELIEQAKTLDFNGMRIALGQEVRKPEGEYLVCPRCGEIFLKAEAKKAKKGE